MEVGFQPYVARLLQGPNDVHQGGGEGLHLIAEAVPGAQGLDQWCYPAVIVPRHHGEEGCSIWKLRCPLNQSMKSEGSTLQVAAS